MKKKTTTKKGKRHDGRANNELRKMEAKVGVIKNADGSAMFKIGNTIAIAAVYGPRNLYPSFLKNHERGILRCNYNMMSFSGSGDRVRPGQNRRSKEISMVIGKSLTPVLKLEKYPNSVVDVFVELIQTDAGTRCAGITAASMALANAGFEMKGLVCSVSAGLVNGQVVIDLDKTEEDIKGTVDIPIAVVPRKGDITLLQLDGLIKKDQLKEAVKLGKEACKKIYDIQKKAIVGCFEK